VTEPRRNRCTRPGLSGSGLAAVCAVILAGDLLLTVLWASAAQAGFGSTRPGIGWVLLAAAGSAAIGAVCVAVLGWVSLRRRREGAAAEATGNRHRGTTWVSGVAILKLALFFVTMVVLGAFTDLQGQLVLALGLLEAATVLWLAVSTGRALVRTAQRAD